MFPGESELSAKFQDNPNWQSNALRLLELSTKRVEWRDIWGYHATSKEAMILAILNGVLPGATFKRDDKPQDLGDLFIFPRVIPDFWDGHEYKSLDSLPSGYRHVLIGKFV